MSSAKQADKVTRLKSESRDPAPEKDVGEKLTEILAELFASRMKAQVYHWNFEGPRFYGVHKITEEIYTQWDEYIDDVAERLKAIGGNTISSFTEIAETAKIKNDPEDKSMQPEHMLQDMIASLEHLNRDLKSAVEHYGENEDPVSEDLLIEILGKSEKFCWMLESLEE